MTVGTLFGIKFIGWHPEDVVALNANAMEHTERLFCRGRRGFPGVRRRFRGCVAHGRILACKLDFALATQPGIPACCGGRLNLEGKVAELCGELANRPDKLEIRKRPLQRIGQHVTEK